MVKSPAMKASPKPVSWRAMTRQKKLYRCTVMVARLWGMPTHAGAAGAAGATSVVEPYSRRVPSGSTSVTQPARRDARAKLSNSAKARRSRKPGRGESAWLISSAV